MELAKKFTDFLRKTRIPSEYNPEGTDAIITKFSKDFLNEFNSKNKLTVESNNKCNFSENTCYLLAYHCILLSKDLHRDNNREDDVIITPPPAFRKMEKEEFLRAAQACHEFGLDHVFLSAIYDEVANEKIL